MAAAKKTKSKKNSPSKKSKEVATVNLIEETTETKTTRKSRKKTLTFALIIVVIAALLFYFKSFFVAATVNGKPISRWSVVKELEKQQGKEALDSLVTETLILSESKAKNISISQDERNAEITKIEETVKAQGQNLEELLKLRGMTKDDLVRQIVIQKSVEKLLADKLNITDEEINKYIADNKESFNADQKPEDIKAEVKDLLSQQKLGQEFQTWLSEVKAKANINYYVSY